jgi:Uma2 family endonuclease
MTALAPPLPPRLAPGANIPPAVKLWTVEEFHRLGELGLFEGRRAMLIHGEILEEGPMNPPHAIASTKTEDLIRELFGRTYHVRVQKPLVFGLTIDPEPDVAVVPGRPADYTTHPSTATLVIEVSDSSLKYDTMEKVELYAAAGIPEYWVLDLNSRQLLVFRDPTANGYGTKFTVPADGSVSPLAVPAASVKVAELLP